jgi:glycosyltransferase involved in cell wall biosynthesis
MSSRHYKIIVAGFNCYDMIQNCVDSIAGQTYKNYQVCLVDDASTDERQLPLVVASAEKHGWDYISRQENAGALRSQHEGITLMDPQDGDVIVWVDMDDAFATSEALEILDSYYEPDTPMTYGSYQSVPYSPTCPEVARYPVECETKNDYRNLPKWGIRYNHLRTVRWELYKNIDVETDFKFNGRWMHLASDAAVMVPCLEMSGGKYKYIPDILYSYTSDNPISEWRKAPNGTVDMHAYLQSLKKKRPVLL